MRAPIAGTRNSADAVERGPQREHLRTWGLGYRDPGTREERKAGETHLRSGIAQRPHLGPEARTAIGLREDLKTWAAEEQSPAARVVHRSGSTRPAGHGRTRT